MKLTLYKNCKLNDKYLNVFSFRKYQNEYLIDKYLNTLTKAQLIIDNVYQENNGQLNFEINGVLGSYDNIYEYNYMKVVSDDNTLLRYCFIDDISISNEIAIISYSEDIWHSYGKSMNITESFLSRNRLANISSFHNLDLKSLPIKYQSNLPLTINKTEEITSFNVVVELQYYKGTRQGDLSSRVLGVYMMSIFKTIDNVNHNVVDLTLNEAETLINRIVSCQSAKSLSQNNGTVDYYYEIGDTFILPSNYNLKNYFNIQYDIPLYQGKIQITAPSDSIFVPNEMFTQGWGLSNENLYNFITLKEYSIDSDRKIKSIGTFSSQEEIEFNGNDYNLELKCNISQNDFKLFMSIASGFYEITEDYKYDNPFTAITGEENGLRRLNRTMTNIVKTTSIIGSIASVGATSGSLSKAIDKQLFTKKGKMTTSAKRLSYAAKLNNQLVSNVKQGAMESGSDMIDLIQNNAPLYSSSSYTVTNNKAFENAKYGICYYTYQNITDFINYLNNAIDNSGYQVFEWINNFDITGILSSTNQDITLSMRTTNKFNFIQFASINIYGKFPRSIAEVLENILLKGTKVWFNESEIS